MKVRLVCRVHGPLSVQVRSVELGADNVIDFLAGQREGHRTLHQGGCHAALVLEVVS